MTISGSLALLLNPTSPPKDWRTIRLDEIVESAALGTASRGSDTGPFVRLIKMGDILWGGFDLSAIENISSHLVENSEELRLQHGDFLFNTRNTAALVGKAGTWDREFGQAIFDNNILRLRFRDDANSFYLTLALNHGAGRRAVRSLACGSTSVSAIYWRDLKQLRVLLPPRQEQDRIVEIARTWNEGLEKIGRLIEAKSIRFRLVSMALLTGRLRLSADDTKWSNVSFGDVTSELADRNSGRLGIDAVMGVNKVHGIIPMKDHVRSENLARYKVVPPNSFAYNPMRLNIGSLAINTLGREILVSPDYVAFAARDQCLSYRYFDHLRRSSIWSNFVSRAGSGSVRVRIYYEHLSKLTFDIPNFEVQGIIADAIDVAKREIDVLQYQMRLLERQRRGLLQKLLTGEWRVPVRDVDVDTVVARVAEEAAQ
jgi:type I restriction enzyme S subunit